MLKIKRRLETGFTLVEILIAGTLLSVLALGMTAMIVQQAQSQRSAQAKVSFTQLQMQLSAAAASPTAIQKSAQAVGVQYNNFWFSVLDASMVNGSDLTANTIDPAIYRGTPTLPPPDSIFQRAAEQR